MTEYEYSFEKCHYVSFDYSRIEDESKESYCYLFDGHCTISNPDIPESCKYYAHKEKVHKDI